MSDSILLTVRSSCNVGEDNADFDTDLITITNSVLAVLTQLGVGPSGGFFITGVDETWTELLGEGDTAYLNHVKTYVGLKVRLIFDPPVSSAVKDSLTNTVNELEWRVNVAAENHDLEEVKNVECSNSGGTTG